MTEGTHELLVLMAITGTYLLGMILNTIVHELGHWVAYRRYIPESEIKFVVTPDSGSCGAEDQVKYARVDYDHYLELSLSGFLFGCPVLILTSYISLVIFMSTWTFQANFTPAIGRLMVVGMALIAILIELSGSEGDLKQLKWYFRMRRNRTHLDNSIKTTETELAVLLKLKEFREEDNATEVS